MKTFFMSIYKISGKNSVPVIKDNFLVNIRIYYCTCYCSTLHVFSCSPNSIWCVSLRLPKMIFINCNISHIYILKMNDLLKLYTFFWYLSVISPLQEKKIFKIFLGQDQGQSQGLSGTFSLEIALIHLIYSSEPEGSR